MTTRHTFWTSHRAAAALPAGVLSRDRLAVLAGLVVPLALAVVLAPFRASFPDTDAALALLLTVVAVAANGNRLAGVLASASATVWFDFFLTRPYERFAIAGRTDIETTVLLLVIGVAITEIAVWGRRQHAAASRRAGYLDGISAAAMVPLWRFRPNPTMYTLPLSSGTGIAACRLSPPVSSPRHAD